MRTKAITALSASAIMTLGIATPANAVGLGDLAKVVLGGSSVLKKSETTCGKAAALAPQESMTIQVARQAAQKVLSPEQFLALESASDTQATTAAQSPTFCNETKAKKPGLLKSIANAGKKLLGAKMLGGM
jgi:hypothetical protein